MSGFNAIDFVSARLSGVASSENYKCRAQPSQIMSGQRLSADLKLLENLEQRLYSRRSRYWAYAYLSKLYKFYCCLSRSERAYFCDLRKERRASMSVVMRKLICLTSKADRKTRSRWLQALRYAHQNRDVWMAEKSLMNFLKESGGIAGCARKVAKPRKRSRVSKARCWA